MFAKMMAAKPPADSTDTAATGGSLAGASGVAGASGAPVSADMSSLNQALSSGNVSAAQLAFQSLQTDLHPAQKPHHHFWNAGSQDASTSSATAAPAATPATTSVQASSPDPGSAAGQMAAADPQMRTLLAGLTQ
jgi:hypothetical protein